MKTTHSLPPHTLRTTAVLVVLCLSLQTVLAQQALTEEQLPPASPDAPMPAHTLPGWVQQLPPVPVPSPAEIAAATDAAATPWLRMAQRLSPHSLADNHAQRQLLEALYAMLNEHPEVLQAQASLESAGHDLNTARGARWPTFKVGTTSGSAERNGRQQDYNAINAEVRMSVLDGGAINADIRAAGFTQSARGDVLHGTRQNILLDALTALLNLQRYEHKARIAAESADIIERLAVLEERRAELGAVGRNDLRQAASRQASARAQQHALEAQRADALARFTRYYSFTPEPDWLPPLNIPAFWMPRGEEQALQDAEAHSSELREVQQQIERARAEVDRSKAQRLPTLDAVVTHSHDPKGILYSEGTRYGVELNWDFGNGFELRDRIRKSLNELQNQEAQYENVRRQVRETASAGWGRVESGAQRESQLADAVKQAAAAFEGRRRLLEAGRGSLSQVLDAQLDMQTLMLEEIDARYDQRIQQLQLVRTTGQLLPQDTPHRWLHPLFQSFTETFSEDVTISPPTQAQLFVAPASTPSHEPGVQNSRNPPESVQLRPETRIRSLL